MSATGVTGLDFEIDRVQVAEKYCFEAEYRGLCATAHVRGFVSRLAFLCWNPAKQRDTDRPTFGGMGCKALLFFSVL
jgi:hypothetical protein